MGRPDDTARLLSQGRNPLEIASILGISLASVLSYLDRAVGEGLIRRSDIYFSFPPELRATHSSELKRYTSARVALGDLYEDVRQIEVSLHAQVRQVLVDKYGAEERGWWRQGVPEAVRVKCQERRERDVDDPCEAYCYTDLLDLGKIIEGEWNLFKNKHPACYSTNRKALLEHLARLNRIRNKVMHPVRSASPCEEDFDFVRQFERALELTA